MRNVQFLDLGMVNFATAWEQQECLFAKLVEEKLKRRITHSEGASLHGYLLFCEHPHVYTMGKSGNSKNMLVDESRLAELNASFYRINRGGDITYHGPGQIVGYPIFDLDFFFTDIGRYLRCLEETVIRTLAEFGVSAGRLKGVTGVWLDPDLPHCARKICAIGIRLSRWVTMHGFAFNVNTDLSYYEHIIPCGIKGKAVTSLQKEVGLGSAEIEMEKVKELLKKHLCEIFDIRLI